jgi:hypothetical protein
MDIDVSPLDFEIKRVLESTQRNAYFDYSGMFKYGNEYLPAMRIVGITSKNHYQTDVAPDLSIQVLIGVGDLNMILYPNRANLEFILTREMINPNGNVPLPGTDTVLIESYIAKLSDEVRPASAENNEQKSVDRFTLNLTDLVVVTIGLRTKAADYFSKMEVGGTFRETYLGPLLQGLLDTWTKTADLPEDEALLGISVDVENSNQDPQAMVTVKQGVRLIDLADYFQKEAGGMYPTGMAQFIQDRVWYVFPPYAPTKFDDSTNKMVVILVPSKRYPVLERTYMVENNVTTILVTGDKKIQSPKEDMQQVSGNGSYFANANKMMGEFSKGKDGISLMSRNDQLSDFVGEQRADGQNVMRMAPEQITDNPFVVMSRLALGQGHVVMVNWHNADPRVFEPGMAIRTMFMNDGDISILDGSLIGLELNVVMKGTTMIADGYEVIASLLIFVKSNSDSNDLLGLG